MKSGSLYNKSIKPELQELCDSFHKNYCCQAFSAQDVHSIASAAVSDGLTEPGLLQLSSGDSRRRPGPAASSLGQITSPAPYALPSLMFGTLLCCDMGLPTCSGIRVPKVNCGHFYAFSGLVSSLSLPLYALPYDHSLRRFGFTCPPNIHAASLRHGETHTASIPAREGAQHFVRRAMAQGGRYQRPRPRRTFRFKSQHVVGIRERCRHLRRGWLDPEAA